MFSKRTFIILYILYSMPLGTFSQSIVGADVSYISMKHSGGTTYPLELFLSGKGYKIWFLKKMRNAAFQGEFFYNEVSGTTDFYPYADMHIPTVNIEKFFMNPLKTYGGTVNVLIYYLKDIMYLKAGLSAVISSNPEYYIYAKEYDFSYSYPKPTKPDYIYNYEVNSDKTFGWGTNFGSGILIQFNSWMNLHAELIYQLINLHPNVIVKDFGSTYSNNISSGKQNLNLTFFTFNLGLAVKISKK